MSEFAVIVTSRGVKADPAPFAQDGARFWVTRSDFGPTASPLEAFSVEVGDAPEDLLTFSTEGAATDFARSWEGHPWWCRPKSFEVVRVEPKTRLVRVGYRRVP